MYKVLVYYYLTGVGSSLVKTKEFDTLEEANVYIRKNTQEVKRRRDGYFYKIKPV